jgi:hypothetical protein
MAIRTRYGWVLKFMRSGPDVTAIIFPPIVGDRSQT